jgi:hypothetical protein
MRLIDADRLLTDRMKRYYYHLKNGDIAIPIIDIEHAPTIDAVSVVRGEWIDKGRHLWECSNCKMMIYSESEQDRSEFHKWCSRCGARMKGEDDD